MTVKEFLESTYEPDNQYQVRKRIRCVDGWNILVQGGTQYHYCTPRAHINEYISVELGFPSHCDPDLMEYAEEPRKCRKTVYGYVPIEIIEAVVAKHGGIKD